MKEIKELIGRWIKELRKEKGLNQEQLAELANMDWRSLSNVENGHTFPSKKLFDLAKALNVTLPELFDFEHLKEDIQTQKKYIAENIYNYPDDKVTIIYRMMKAMR